MNPVHPTTGISLVSRHRHELEARAAEERLVRRADRIGFARILPHRAGRHRGESRRRLAVV